MSFALKSTTPSGWLNAPEMICQTDIWEQWVSKHITSRTHSPQFWRQGWKPQPRIGIIETGVERPQRTVEGGDAKREGLGRGLNNDHALQSFTDKSKITDWLTPSARHSRGTAMRPPPPPDCGWDPNRCSQTRMPCICLRFRQQECKPCDLMGD